MRKVFLYGALAKGIGKGPHMVDASRLSEIVSYFNANYPKADFENRIRPMMIGVYRGKVAKNDMVSEVEASWELGDIAELHFMPEVKGKKKGGIFKAILGAVLIGAAMFFSGGALGAALPGFLGTVGLSYGSLALVGAGLVLSAFATPPKAPTSQEKDLQQSAMYRGPLNTQEQGECVPLVYGHDVTVGGMVIATSLDVEEIPVGTTVGATPMKDPVIVRVGG